MTHPTLTEIHNSLSPNRRANEKGILFVQHVYRPGGVLLAWLLIRLRVPCKAVVVLGMAIGLLGCLAIATGANQIVVLTGCVLILLRIWLDYADGTVARVTHTTDKEGAYLDLACDNVIGILFPISVGIYAGIPIWGLVMALLYAWSNLTLQDGKVVFGEDEDVYRTDGLSLWRLAFMAGLNVQALFYPALLVAVMIGRVDIYLYTFTLLAGLEMLAILYGRLKYARGK